MSTNVTMGDTEPKEETEEKPVVAPTGVDFVDVEDEDLPEEERPIQVAEDPGPDEPLFDGGPTFAQIEEWKEAYPKVYVTSFGPDTHVVWRTLTRPEYKTHVRQMEDLANMGEISQGDAQFISEENLGEQCILFPPYRRDSDANEVAGTVSTIAQEIMEASGFVALDIREL